MLDGGVYVGRYITYTGCLDVTTGLAFYLPRYPGIDIFTEVSFCLRVI